MVMTVLFQASRVRERAKNFVRDLAEFPLVKVQQTTYIINPMTRPDRIDASLVRYFNGNWLPRQTESGPTSCLSFSIVGADVQYLSIVINNELFHQTIILGDAESKSMNVP